MSIQSTPKLDLPYLAEGQAQKHLSVNEALAHLDGLVQCAVESRATTAQPALPAEGAVYLLPTGRTGALWSLHPAGTLMRYEANGWEPLPVGTGALAYVKDESLFVLKAASGWTEMTSAIGALQNLTRLGVGTTADATNPLSAKLNKALFTAKTAAEGGDGDVRFTLNKETASDVLSLLFQTAYSGRAELGLIGDDKLTLKTSSDGSAWTDAIRVGPTGVVRQPAKPVLSVRRTAGAVSVTASLSIMVFNAVVVDTASAYNTSTGRFTCPAEGLYRMTLGALLSGSTPSGHGANLYAARNGVGRGLFFLQAAVGGHYPWAQADAIFQCSAGDLLDIRVAGDTDAAIYGDNFTGLTIEFLG